MRRPRCLALALLCATGVLAAGCGTPTHLARPASPHAHGETQSVPVDPQRGGTLTLPSGVQVVVPAGSVAVAGTLSGTPVSPPAVAPAGMMLAGDVYDLHLSGTALAGPVTVRLPAPALLGSDGRPTPAPLLAFYDTTHARWMPVSARYDLATRTLTASSAHLSLWSAMSVDTGKLLGAAHDLLGGFLGVSDTVAQPSCPNDAAARTAGVTVVSDRGNLVHWCVGRTGTGQVLVRVADNRDYAVEVDRPASWPMKRLGGSDPVGDQLVNWAARRLTVAAPDTAVSIVLGAHTIEFSVPAGHSGVVHVLPSAPAYLVSALGYGLDTLAMVAAQIPGGPKADPVKSARVLAAVFDTKDCAKSLEGLLRSKVTDAASAGGLFRTVTELGTACMADAWKTAYGMAGWTATFVVGVLLWLADGIKLVIDGLRAALDTALYWRDYRISVSAPGLDCSAAGAQPEADHLLQVFGTQWPGEPSWAAAPDFAAFAQPRIAALVSACGSDWVFKVIEDMNVVGVTWRALSAWATPLRPFLQPWSRHGESLTLRPDYTGELVFRTYSEPSAATAMWYEHDSLRLSLAPDGRTLTAQITAVRFDDGQGTPVPPTTGYRGNVGDLVAFTLKPNGALNMHGVRPLAPPNTGPDLAFCTMQVSDNMCGA